MSPPRSLPLKKGKEKEKKRKKPKEKEGSDQTDDILSPRARKKDKSKVLNDVTAMNRHATSLTLPLHIYVVLTLCSCSNSPFPFAISQNLD